MTRVLLQKAYVLHRRAYRETSFLVDFFTEEYGRLTAIARGARQSRTTNQGLLQPFIPLLVSWSGKGELMTLTYVEAHGEVTFLRGDCLFAGLYLNELVMALLQKWDEHPALFQRYTETIAELQKTPLMEKTLRTFEKSLLEEIGYGLLPRSPLDLQQAFASDDYYRFIPEHGFEKCTYGEKTQTTSNIFSGKHLIAIANNEWEEKETLQAAKRLMRFVLTPLLGNRQIHSRQLFTVPE